MPKNTQTPLLDAYNELNEANKKILRDEFNKKFDYSENSPSFWRKLNNPNQLWNFEKSFFCKYFKKKEMDLFPKESEVAND